VSKAGLPTAFGRYQVLGLVGEGSMGRVYRAFDPMAKRVVAIKTLRTEYVVSTRGEEYRRRFRREAQAAGNLAHSYITTVFDVGDDFFVMELLEGVTLQRLLQQKGRLDLGAALQILGPVAEGLDYAHNKGTIHRDIKPSNIMILPDGRPKIVDFGVAHSSGPSAARARSILQVFSRPSFEPCFGKRRRTHREAMRSIREAGWRGAAVNSPKPFRAVRVDAGRDPSL
jgi:serine/threonine-protein kinase